MKKKKVLIGLIAALLVVGIAVGSYFIVVRVQSKEYNLIDLKETDLPQKQEAVEDGYVQLSMVKMHYVRYGEGAQPVVLIHGNGGSCDSLKELAQYLANDYSVYCIDSRCQGKSSDPGVITYDLMATDVYEFIQQKTTVKPYVLGHSDGGIVALSLASLYPDDVAAVVSCGANSHPDKFKWYFTFGVKVMNLFHKDKLNDLMLELPDFTPEYLARITAPTYVVAGSTTSCLCPTPSISTIISRGARSPSSRGRRTRRISPNTAAGSILLQKISSPRNRKASRFRKNVKTARIVASGFHISNGFSFPNDQSAQHRSTKAKIGSK